MSFEASMDTSIISANSYQLLVFRELKNYEWAITNYKLETRKQCDAKEK